MYSPYMVLWAMLVIIRVISSLYSIISDCDETYNYWEPLHYTLYGYGFQTWEYSPRYAIRSYLYIILHYLPVRLFTPLLSKLGVFYLLRMLLALSCCICEYCFVRALKRCFSSEISYLTLILLTSNAGMFLCCSSFLPSTFAMYCIMLAYSAWLTNRNFAAIFFIALGSLVGWPFSALLGIPIAIDMVFLKGKYILFLAYSLLSFTLVSVPLLAVDSYYFGRFVFAPFNIMYYNLIQGTGSQLYGVEPVSYYIMNGALNFNIIFPLGIFCIIVCCVWKMIDGKIRTSPTNRIYDINFLILFSIGFYSWIAVFFLQPHKEERFLFPIYPLLIVHASISLSYIQSILHRYSSRLGTILVVAILLLHATLSLSRVSILLSGYRAPINVYSEALHVVNRGVVCVGKEWHRFPSNFFMIGDKNRLQYVTSEFRGQLPKYFEESSNGTKIIPSNMNDKNSEEPSRYYDINSCDYLIDLDTPHSTVREPRYLSQNDRWQVLFRYPFLDKLNSNKLYRAFYIPLMSDNPDYVKYIDYLLLKRLL